MAEWTLSYSKHYEAGGRQWEDDDGRMMGRRWCYGPSHILVVNACISKWVKRCADRAG